MEKSTRNVLIASGTGLAVGALLGVLFAPAKGSETRAAIKGKVNEIKDKVAEVDPLEAINKLKASVENGLDNGKTTVKKELIEQIQKLEAAIDKA